MHAYPYAIEWKKNGFGADVAFKVYPLNEGQLVPFEAIASEEEVRAWDAYQEACAAIPIPKAVEQAAEAGQEPAANGKPPKRAK